MIIIGVDYHPSFQQIAFMDQTTGCTQFSLVLLLEQKQMSPTAKQKLRLIIVET
jgi:hypothetical protein